MRLLPSAASFGVENTSQIVAGALAVGQLMGVNRCSGVVRFSTVALRETARIDGN
jgi:hypothetical protein